MMKNSNENTISHTRGQIVAKAIAKIQADYGNRVSKSGICCLTYIAFGTWLAIHRRKLYTDQIYVYNKSPYIPTVISAYKVGFQITPELTNENVLAHLTEVCSLYGTCTVKSLQKVLFYPYSAALNIAAKSNNEGFDAVHVSVSDIHSDFLHWIDEEGDMLVNPRDALRTKKEMKVYEDLESLSI